LGPKYSGKRLEGGRERVSRRKRGNDTIFRIQKLITALYER
jgi:hypothetical protein